MEVDKDKNLNKGNTGKPDIGAITKPPMRGFITWIVVIGMAVLMVQLISGHKDKYKEIPYSPDFVNLVTNKQVQECEIINEVSGIKFVRGVYLPGKGEAVRTPQKFKVYVSGDDEELRKFLNGNVKRLSIPPQNPYMWQIISSALPIIIIFGVLYFLFIRQIRSAGHGALSFGKSRAKMLNRDTNKVTFADVAGIEEAQEEVEEIIEFLKDPKKFQKLGGRIPKGVLLMGPPGTGKTLLAKAIAGEADVPFFSISGSDFVEMFVGVGASRVRDMFEQGKKNAPCIIFVDEIDAVGRSRFTGIGGGHDEREQTLNALLVEMDGFDTQEGVIILAATNRPDVLDPALLRPGRFDRQIVIDLPAIEGRESILKIHSKKIKLSENADLRRLARGTPGFSGADLANLLNEAALLAARENKPAVELMDLEEARDKVKWGRERRSRKMDDKDKENTAYHESGHALVQQIVDGTEPLHKVTIIPRGMYLGATMSLPDKDRYTEKRSKLLSELAVCMGGRVAEEVIFKDISTGASNDIKVATTIAHHMVCDWGMSSVLGPRAFGNNEELTFMGRGVSKNLDYSDTTANKIDDEVNKLLMDSYKLATDIITREREKLDIIAQRLLQLETIDGRDIEEIVEHGRVLSEEERAKIDAEKVDAEKKDEDNREEKDEKAKIRVEMPQEDTSVTE